jgi:hypothetical protein
MAGAFDHIIRPFLETPLPGPRPIGLGGLGGLDRGAQERPPVLRVAEEGFAATVSRLVGMSLSQYALDGQPFEIRVPWWRETLWWVPDARHAETLVGSGVSRGRVWTAAEIADVVGAGLDPGALRLVQVAKEEFNGKVVAVHPRRSGDNP